MTIDQQADTRKDKRLLVLLAFGALTLLFSAPAMLPERPLEQQFWNWVEEKGEVGRLQRIVRSGDGRKGDTPPGVLPGMGHHPSVSPRLAYLLGLPLAVNRASLDELALLEGIGPKLAASIVDYRTRHGRISNAQELLAVPGIGERLAAKLAPCFTFE